MSDYPMLISNKLHSFRNFYMQQYNKEYTLWYNHPVFNRGEDFITL